MAVNLSPPEPGSLHEVRGVELGVAMAGVRKAGRNDLVVLTFAPGSAVAGVFTRNRFCAAPVAVAKRHLASRSEVRALVVNTGNANAGTGEDGVRRAQAVCQAVAARLHCAPEQVLPFSTGVIMEPLPLERIEAALPAAIADRRADNWAAAAEAIMTTDTVPKARSLRVALEGATVTVTGIAKGSGMIRPDMATMLAFLCCDAALPSSLLSKMLTEITRESFNCITVDGDTSTNDAFILAATGASGWRLTEPSGADYARLLDALRQVAVWLAQAVVRDGEGASKFVTVRVEGGRHEDECRRVAYAIAHSPLVKTAFFAGDPNLGRILAAIGNAGIPDLDAAQVDLYIDDVLVASAGARHPAYREAQGVAAMRKPEFTVRALLGRGSAAAQLWTCDLSYDYVKINAEYRT